MRRTNLVLLALVQLCAAKQPGFSIHEDLLAHPQFEVVFSESYILEKDAQLLLAGPDQPQPSSIPNATPDANADADAKTKTITGTDNADADAVPSHDFLHDFAAADDGSEQISETFELINVPPLQYLCSVPVLAPPPGTPNQTATDLARAAEARELARAEDRGTEILDALEGECMYYAAGWWSYSFCYGQEVVQFHAVQGKNGKAMKDPHSMEFVLGRMKSRQERDTAMEAEEGSGSGKGREKVNQNVRTSDVDVQKPIGTQSDDVPKKKKLDVHKTELQVKGDQKYMVQRLGGGTVCDLTGRDRTLEIQYHCNQGASSDRISWIKEVTTCAYVMEVRTPRLCQEPAFLPPKPKHAHPISCRLVVHSEHELALWHEQKTIEAREAMASKDKDKDQQQPTEDGETASNEGLLIGGVVVGARQIFADEVQHAADAVPKLQNTKTAKAAAKAAAIALKKGHPGGVLGGATTRDALQKAAAAAKTEGGTFVRVIARGLGNDDAGNAGAVEVVDTAELKALGVNVAAINELVRKMGTLAGGKPWHVTAYDVGEESLVLRAYIDTDEGEEETEGGAGGSGGGGGDSEEATEAGENSREDAEDEGPTLKVVVMTMDAGRGPIPDVDSEEDSQESQGSKETFKKDEL